MCSLGRDAARIEVTLASHSGMQFSESARTRSRSQMFSLNWENGRTPQLRSRKNVTLQLLWEEYKQANPKKDESLLRSDLPSPCPGRCAGRQRESPPGGDQAARVAAGSSCRDRRGRHRGNPNLLQHMPTEHWRSLRTNNPLERLMREIRRRTRVVGAYPDGKSALTLVAARLRHVADTKLGGRNAICR